MSVEELKIVFKMLDIYYLHHVERNYIYVNVRDISLKSFIKLLLDDNNFTYNIMDYSPVYFDLYISEVNEHE